MHALRRRRMAEVEPQCQDLAANCSRWRGARPI